MGIQRKTAFKKKSNNSVFRFFIGVIVYIAIVTIIFFIIFHTTFAHDYDGMLSWADNNLGIILFPICVIACPIWGIVWHFVKRASKWGFSWNEEQQHEFLRAFFKNRHPESTYHENEFIAPVIKCEDEKMKHHVKFPAFSRDVDKVEGSNYLKENITDKISFTYSDLFLSEAVYNRYGMLISHAQFFDGSFLVIKGQHSKIKNNTISIMAINNRYEYWDKFPGQNIETENVEFNECFCCKSTDEESFFYLLSPEFIEYLTKLREQIHDFILVVTKEAIMLVLPRVHLFAYNKSVTAMQENAEKDYKFIKDIATSIIDKGNFS